MSNQNNISLTLNLKEPNIHFSDDYLSEETIRGVKSLVFKGLLTYDTPNICPICGCKNENNAIVKNGTKPSLITMPSISHRVTYLRLYKQRWICRNCNSSFSAKTDLVKENCYISENTILSIILLAKEKFSQKDIAKMLNISCGTINSLLTSLYKNFIIKKIICPNTFHLMNLNRLKT